MMSAQDYEVIRLELPCASKYLLAARLAIAGVASRAGLTVEDIEQLKVAVGEACTNVIYHAFDEASIREGRARIKIEMRVREGEVQVDIEDEGRGFDAEDVLAKLDADGPTTSSLGLYLMRELSDELKIESAPGSGTKVMIVKRVTR